MKSETKWELKRACVTFGLHIHKLVTVKLSRAISIRPMEEAAERPIQVIIKATQSNKAE